MFIYDSKFYFTKYGSDSSIIERRNTKITISNNNNYRFDNQYVKSISIIDTEYSFTNLQMLSCVTKLVLNKVVFPRDTLHLPKSITDLTLQSMSLTNIKNIFQVKYLTISTMKNNNIFSIFPRWKIFKKICLINIPIKTLHFVPRTKTLAVFKCGLTSLDGISSTTTFFKSYSNRLNFNTSYRHIKLDLLEIIFNKFVINIGHLPSAYCLKIMFSVKKKISKIWDQTISLKLYEYNKTINPYLFPESIIFLDLGKNINVQMKKKNNKKSKNIRFLNYQETKNYESNTIVSIYHSGKITQIIRDYYHISMNFPLLPDLNYENCLNDKTTFLQMHLRKPISFLPDFKNLISLEIVNKESRNCIRSFELKNLKHIILDYVNLLDFEFLNVTYHCQLKELHFKNTVNLNVKIVPRTVEILTIDDDSCQSLKGMNCSVKKLFLSISENFDIQSIPISVDYLIYYFISGNTENILFGNCPYYIPFIKHAWYENYRVNPEYKKRIVGIVKFQRLFRKYYYGGIRISSDKMISRHLIRILEDVGQDVSEFGEYLSLKR